MSDHEDEARQKSSTNVTLMVVGIAFAVGCMIVCVGLAGFGLVLPMRQKQAAAARQAEAEARQAAMKQALIERARAEQAKSARPNEAPAKDESSEPAAADASPEKSSQTSPDEGTPVEHGKSEGEKPPE